MEPQHNLVTNLAFACSPAYYNRAIYNTKRIRLQTGIATVKSYGNHVGDGGLVPGIMAISRLEYRARGLPSPRRYGAVLFPYQAHSADCREIATTSASCGALIDDPSNGTSSPAS